MIAGDLFTAGQHHTAYLTIVDVDIFDTTLKAYFTAQCRNVGAHLFHHGYQFEGADVGLAHIKNFMRCTGFHEFGEHFAAMVHGIFDLAVELAVGKCTGAAFAELHIRFGD